ncbi:unnamed protein product [Didymodactylos carnosus]|uniref:Uncharacterized protein n=1 Tax=Didymodactylos carnosus TaxID=1234261 RepID=A0A8S2FLQ9_9BILA|nr:unnamed protein product [Didymodactylos carnosus]CAF4296689.1 unnamed protein product [Didymodactylos carnosus]
MFTCRRSILVILLFSTSSIFIYFKDELYSYVYAEFFIPLLTSLDESYVQDITKTRKLLNIPRVIVSLSSFGPRLLLIDDTIHTVFRQSYKPDIVYLNIPKEIKRYNTTYEQIPHNINLLVKQYYPKIQILTGKDYGPSTKLLGISNK